MTIPVEGYYLDNPLGLGRISEHSADTHIRSFAAEGTDVEIGHAVMDGTDPETQMKLFASQTGHFRGVAGYSEDAGDLDNMLFEDGDSLPVIDGGVVTVYTEEAITDISTQAVRVRTNGAGAGNFLRTADTGNTVAITQGAEWRSEGASGTAVKLYLNPPFTILAD